MCRYGGAVGGGKTSRQVKELMTQLEQRMTDKLKAELAKAHSELQLRGKVTFSMMYVETLTLKVERDVETS
jgi:hypothetical protein